MCYDAKHNIRQEKGAPVATTRKQQPVKDGLTGISVIVPVKNEADNVRPLVEEIQNALGTAFDLEIVYVDDGSSDTTLETLRILKTEFPALKILAHHTSCGQSAAVHTGVCYAAHEWIAVLDGDGQNDPADLPKLWEWVSSQENPWCMAIGRRVKRQDAGIRKFSSKVAAEARRLLLKDSIPDSGCGIKILPRALFLELPYFDHMHRFMPSLVKRHGGRVASIPVAHRPRTRGVSKYGTLDRALVGIFDLIGVIWLLRRYRKRNVATY